MSNSWTRIGAAVAVLATAFTLVIAVPAHAQDKPDNWLMRLARGAAAAAIEADMGDAQAIDLEDAGLTPVVYSGPVLFGISGLELKDAVGLRLKAYLYNPSEEEAAVPIPIITNFVLVDQVGRRLEVASMAVERLEKKAKQLTVPPLERLGINLLFVAPQPNAHTLVLKVGSAGMVRGIPLSGGAAVMHADAGAANTSVSPQQPAMHEPVVQQPALPDQPRAHQADPPRTSTQGQPGAATPLVGSWSRGTIATHIVTQGGGFSGAYSDGFLYTFYPDGTYEFSGIMEAAGAGRILMYAGGRYAVQGSQLTIAREGGTFINQKTGSERQLQPETKQYRWRIERDPYGTRPVLTLTLPGVATEDIFYRREN